jgi:hypothetical protein
MVLFSVYILIKPNSCPEVGFAVSVSFHICLEKNRKLQQITTLATVQCCNELASHGRGLTSRLGTLSGTCFGTE